MIKPIKTEADYEEAVARIETLLDAEPGSPEEDELDILSILVDRYESENFPIDAPDPITLIRFHMEQNGLGQNDLADLLGSKSHASEILNGKRALSVNHMRALHAAWHLPADVLLQPVTAPAA